ncbi:MAG: hypothetical protein ISS67_04270 [Desulfobacterales bacterium]|nr:hypothetical protein [Desulfobacterales bacterium]
MICNYGNGVDDVCKKCNDSLTCTTSAKLALVALLRTYHAGMGGKKRGCLLAKAEIADNPGFKLLSLLWGKGRKVAPNHVKRI